MKMTIMMTVQEEKSIISSSSVLETTKNYRLNVLRNLIRCRQRGIGGDFHFWENMHMNKKSWV